MNRQNALRSMAENVVHHGKNRVMQQVCLGMGFRKCHRFCFTEVHPSCLNATPSSLSPGSSGAGTSTVTRTFAGIFAREGVKSAVIEGDSFHCYDRKENESRRPKPKPRATAISAISAWIITSSANWKTCSPSTPKPGRAKARKYLHNAEEVPTNRSRALSPSGRRCRRTPMFCSYEGLHGAVVTPEHNVAKHPDLLIGVVPVINLEWIQKLWRDQKMRGYSSEAVTDTILRRMPDYVNVICPQFSRTHVNFQRVPVVDTSNPFIARDIPSADESMVIRFANPKGIDFPICCQMIDGSHMSRANTIVVPGGKMELATQLIHAVRLAHDGAPQSSSRVGILGVAARNARRSCVHDPQTLAGFLLRLLVEVVGDARSDHPHRHRIFRIAWPPGQGCLDCRSGAGRSDGAGGFAAGLGRCCKHRRSGSRWSSSWRAVSAVIGIKLLRAGADAKTHVPETPDSRWRLFVNTYLVTALNPRGSCFCGVPAAPSIPVSTLRSSCWCWPAVCRHGHHQFHVVCILCGVGAHLAGIARHSVNSRVPAARCCRLPASGFYMARRPA